MKVVKIAMGFQRRVFGRLMKVVEIMVDFASVNVSATTASWTASETLSLKPPPRLKTESQPLTHGVVVAEA